MKILFFDSPAFAKQDMIDAFEDIYRQERTSLRR